MGVYSESKEFPFRVDFPFKGALNIEKQTGSHGIYLPLLKGQKMYQVYPVPLKYIYLCRKQLHGDSIPCLYSLTPIIKLLGTYEALWNENVTV